ncbi:MAG: GtrA family protein [Terriglobales bacterium]|jgi:putative flippase GtrA
MSGSPLPERSFPFRAPGSQDHPQPALLRWLKFNAVGGMGMVVQLTALVVFRSGLKFDSLLATWLAVEIAVIHNFLWHERFTWRDRPASRRRESWVRLGKFNVSNGGVSLAGNLGLMWLLTAELKWNYVGSNLLAIAVCSLVNFLLGDLFVFAARLDSTSST